MFCNKCGTELTNDSAFCSKCGSKVLPDQTTQPSQEPIASSQKAAPLYQNAAASPVVQKIQRKNSINKGLLISLVVVGALFFVFIVYALVSPDAETSVAPQSSNASVSTPSDPSVASSTSDTQSATTKSTSASQSEPAAEVKPTPAAKTQTEVATKTKAPTAPSTKPKPAPEKTVDIGALVYKDIFDWQMMSDKEKLSLMSDILSVWKKHGDSVDTTAAKLLNEVEGNLGDQAVIFEVACEIHGIDSQKYEALAK